MKLNGNLVLNSDATGEIDNLYIERLTSLPAFNAAQQGRIVYITSSGSGGGYGAAATYYYNNGVIWQPFATGGSATLLASYVANIIASLGTAVSSADGSWVGFTGTNYLNGAGSITSALTTLDSQIKYDDKLADLLDVNLASLANNQYLVYNSSTSKWQNSTLVLGDVTDVTATAAEVNTLHGFTGTTSNLNVLSGTTASAADLNSITGYAAQGVSPTAFGYTKNLTSDAQTQLNNKQPLNTGLTNLSNLANGSGTGIVIQTGVNTFDDVLIVSTNADLVVTNGNGVGGNPTLSLTGNLAALSAQASYGFLVLTAAGTMTADAIVSGTTGTIVVTNGNGIAASPTIDLQTITQGSSGSFLKFTLDGFGRVVDNTPVVIGDLTALLGTHYLPETGGTMSGNINFSTGTVTGLPTPVGASDAANKAYVDAAVANLVVHNAVQAATTADVGASGYSNGTAGVGAALTFGAAVTTLDGVTLANGYRVLVKNQTVAAQNGVYVVTSPTLWTRASDADNSTAGEFAPGYYVYVDAGTVNGKTSWTETALGTGTNEAIIIGTDAVTFTQFSGAGTYTAGNGLVLTGGVFSVDYGAGITSLPSGDVGLALYSTGSGGLILTTDGTSRNPIVGSSLALLLPSGSGLHQDTTGLYIPAAGVSNAQLANSTVTLDVNGSGTGSVALGGTLSVFGNTTQGISTSVSGSTITITAADATTASKGVASFNPANFTTLAGVVSIASAGISNSQLVNPSFGIAGTTGGTQQIALGSTLTVIGGTSPITTASSAGTLTINIADATSSSLGLSSFVSTYFSVSAGAVSLHTTLGSGGITNVASSVDSAAANDLLSYVGSEWVNVTRSSVLGSESIGELSNVTLTSPTTGQTLVWSGGKFVNRPTYYLFSGSSAATSFTVTHGLGQMYCNVTVVDSTNEVVIPQSISFTDADNLTVTFNSAITCTIIVMGVNLS